MVRLTGVLLVVLASGVAVFHLTVPQARRRAPVSATATPTQPAAEAKRSMHTYVTWDRFEVDRWVAAWLVKRFLDPQAEFVFVPMGAPTDESIGTPFDMPGARWSRVRNRSTSDQVWSEIGKRDPAVESIVAVVRELELAYWRIEQGSPAARLRDSLQEFQRTITDPQKRLEAAFERLDRIYAEGGIKPHPPAAK